LYAKNPAEAHAHALAYLASDRSSSPVGRGDGDLLAVSAVGDVLTYFVPAEGQEVVADFDAVDTVLPTSPAEMRFDHIGIAVAPHELLSAVLFHRTVLGLDREPLQEVADPHGLVTSRAVQSENAAVRFAISTSSGSDTSPERFRAASQGSGVQHIAVGTDSIVDVVRSIDSSVVLQIPDNYFVDLEARLGLDSDTIDFLRDHNIMCDQTDEGRFYHLYTRDIHGVFFEFVQRDNYRGFGAANAPVRLAAQSRAR